MTAMLLSSIFTPERIFYETYFENAHIQPLVTQNSFEQHRTAQGHCRNGTGACGNVYKKRVALPGRGKSGSTRTLIATNREDRWIFMYGFEKNERENITQAELAYLQGIAQIFLTYSSDELQLAIAKGEFLEVHHDEA